MNCSSDTVRRAVLIYLLLLMPWTVQARKIIVKMGTLAPDGSSWHQLLVDMGHKWHEATNGNVVLRIYPGGVAGDERDMIRKIRIGQIHAAAVTIEGLTEISRDMNVFYIPMLVDSFEDLDSIRKALSPQLFAELKKNGFRVLSWADIGWAYWFTKNPITVPEQLRKLRLFTWAGDYYTAELWKSAGFHPVPLSSVDILPSLQTGIIDAFPTTPLAALSFQWFALAPNMLDLKWGPVIGAIILSDRIWNSIPSVYHEEMKRISAEVEREARNLVPEAESALAVMGEHGLIVNYPKPAEKQRWVELTTSFYPHIRGTLVPEKIFDRAIELKRELVKAKTTQSREK